ncbi:transcriptional regulator, TetR family [Conexibacter woesei DSM 14684]|uniref:Transcriptional regulator, TetR family n=2 Tax=Conexibacter TaxID=191494 RepID=D3FDX0_CONWI|nr:transcriptional regulator, TetR family [Conexibacter woesei DSM 14684]
MSSNGVADFAEDDRAQAPRPLMPVTQRERLLDGMARTVAAQGYAATSVADVLREARVSRRTFYERFADKEDCFLAAYDAIVALCLERVSSAYDAADSWHEGFERGLDALLELLAAEPAFACLGVVEVLAAGPRGLARRDETMRRFVAFVDVTRAQVPGPLSAPPELVAQAIVGGIYELLYSHIVRGETDRLPDLTGEMLHYTFMLLGSPQRPA